MAVTQAMIDEAKLALHELSIGQSVVEVRDSNGETIRFTVANSSRLKAYISSLTYELAGTQSKAPIRPMF